MNERAMDPNWQSERGLPLEPPPVPQTAWELELELIQILSEMEDTDGEIPERLQQRLFDVTQAAEDKRDAVVGAYKRRLADAEALRKRATAALDRANRADRAAERLRTMMLSIMDAHGLSRLDGVQYRMVKTRNPGHVELEAGFEDDPANVAWVRVSPEVRSADRNAIAKALKHNEEVPGAKLVLGGFRVDFK